MKCYTYTFKELTFKYGLFDSFIDCTYIIHNENKNSKNNSNKLKNIQYQLKKYKPSKKLFIYVNKDVKYKNKDNKINFNLHDIYFHIFQHSLQKNYNHILILHENFIFKRLILQEDISNINNFIKENEHNKIILSIGTFPLLYYMVNKNFNKSLLSLYSYSTIYSKQMRTYLLENKNNYFNYNTYFNTYSNTYFYKKPLIYQKFDEKNKEKMNYFILAYMKLLNFEKKPEKAIENTYKISYIFSNAFFIFISLVLLFIIYFIYLLTYQNSNQYVDS